MKKICLSLFLLLALSALIFADVQPITAQVDQLHDQYQHQKVVDLINSSMSQAKTNQEKAELTWRLARATCYLGNMAEDSGAKKRDILKLFARGEDIAEQAIKLDSGNPNSYFWKSANMGRWGEVKGILDSLFKAKPMRTQLDKAINQDPNFADAFNVLGVLYELLPGAPISFGNSSYSVSFGRKTIWLHEKQIAAGKAKIKYEYYVKLAEHLYKRKWSAAKRKREQPKIKAKYNKYSKMLKKNSYFEGAVTISNQSDREEALAIIKKVVKELDGKPGKTKYDEIDLKEAKELLAKWEK